MQHGSTDSAVQAWLELQCRFGDGVHSALVMMAGEQQQLRALARIPLSEDADVALFDCCQQLWSQRQSIQSQQQLADGRCIISSPITVAGQCFGHITLCLNALDSESLLQWQRALSWGCEWFAWRARERKAGRDQDDRLLGLIALQTQLLKFDDPRMSAQAAVDMLRQKLDCQRVSLSMLQGSRLRVLAVSDSRRVEELSALLKPLLPALQECADQRCTIALPGENDAGLITQQHRALLQQRGEQSLCSIAMLHNGELLGVLCCEQFSQPIIDPVQLRFCEQAALLLGPVMALKSAAGGALSIRQRWRIGGKWRPALLLLPLLLLASLLFDGELELSAQADIHSQSRQLVSAPLDGYIEQAPARPGDKVKAGQLLLRLDGSELQLELGKWQGRHSQHMKSYNSALGSHDRVEINIARAQLAQAAAQLKLLSAQLQRLSIVAPFDGTVSSGDHSQAIGVPVNRGQQLFEVAADGGFRLQLKVDQRDIQQLQLGQRGSLRLASLPGQQFEFEISRITPVAIAADGANYFLAEAQLRGEPAAISSGMTGLAKIAAGSRSWFWLLLHRPWQQLSLWWWRL